MGQIEVEDSLRAISEGKVKLRYFITDGGLGIATFTGKFPINIASPDSAITINITSAASGGSVTSAQRAVQVNFSDGGSGTAQATTALLGSNINAGGTFNIQTGGANGGRFVSGGISPTFAVGSLGQVNNNGGGNPTTAIGSYGLDNSGAGTSIGTAGFSQAGTKRIGGWFSLDTTSAPTFPPSSAALVADNAAQTSVILDCLDNSGSVFKIDDGGDIKIARTITAGGTTGAQTINKAAGTVNFAIGASSLVVTNSLVTANSIILPTIRTNDATLTSVQIVATAGSFTIYANAPATGETSVGFLVTN